MLQASAQALSLPHLYQTIALSKLLPLRAFMKIGKGAKHSEGKTFARELVAQSDVGCTQAVISALANTTS